MARQIWAVLASFPLLLNAREECGATPSRSLAMVQTRHQLVNESNKSKETRLKASNETQNETSWMDQAWKKVENASSSVAETVSEAGHEVWSATKGLGENIVRHWEGNSSKKHPKTASERSGGAPGITSESCVTVKTGKAEAWLTAAAPVGVMCIFGVDPRDEGSHCIEQGGPYGVNGWCWTKKDRSAWGHCSEKCPLSGQEKVLAEKLEEIEKKLDTVSQAVASSDHPESHPEKPK